MNQLIRRLGALTLVVAVSVAGLSASDPAVAATRLAVTAFQSDDASPALIDASRAAITTVGVDGVLVAAAGNGVSAPVPADTQQLVRAHHDRLRAELLVSNYSDAIGDFSEPIAYRLLSSPRNRKAVVAGLVADVVHRGWDGISVDLESLLPRDRGGLTAFVRALRSALPHRATLAIDVTASPARGDYAANGYDLGALARAVDLVELMTYDEHGPWEDVPGPVGELSWQRASVAAARAFVPAARLDLGVAGYGYAWGPHGNVALSDHQARVMAGSRARWNAKVGEWTAHLADGTVIWWSDARSYALRVTLARQLGLHGLAMWDLELSDPLR